MKVALSWLKEFIDLGERSPESIAMDLESIGHEVEAIDVGGLDRVVVGKIVAVDPHPNADRLRVVTVDTGDLVRTIVCGAPNVAVGQLVPVALPGAQLPNGLEIVPRAIRGVESQGMICAEDELGLGDNHEGILVLPETAAIGQPFHPTGIEAVLDIAVTPNRGDALSYHGLARDLAARWRRPITRIFPTVTGHAPKPDVQIEAQDLCDRYTARFISNIQIRDLPDVFARRLEATGHGHYHPVVDLTNYVMEELGVPLHAFDAEKVQLPIIVRRAIDGESIRLLDGKTYPLDHTMLVIADQTGPIALAGIMGGFKTAVSKSTRQIILESAHFLPTSIRKTRMKLKLTTDASYRFERHTDPNMCIPASDRVAQLVKDHLGGQPGELTDKPAATTPEKQIIPFDSTAISRRIGQTIPPEEVTDILQRLGFIMAQKTVTVPSWRPDITVWEDLSEEVARIAGYEQIPRQRLPKGNSTSNEDDRRFRAVEWLKDQLVQAGWTEHIGTSFLSPSELAALNMLETSVIRLANPVTEEAAYLRSTLKVSLLKAAAKNPVFPEISLFEIGTIFQTAAKGVIEEVTAIGLLWTGKKTHPEIIGDKIDQTDVVAAGDLRHFKIRRPLRYVELTIEKLLSEVNLPEQLTFVVNPTLAQPLRMPSRFQPAMRDVAFVGPDAVDLVAIGQTLAGFPSIVDVELFDVYRGKGIPPGQQSAAFHLLLEHPDRTLTTDEIQGTMDRVTEYLMNEKLQIR